MLSLFSELKRRNVIRVAGLYVAGTWLILQVAGTVLQMVEAPIWLSRGIVVALAIGFIPALVFAWAFELTSTGLKREAEIDRTESITPDTGRKLDRIIMVVLALALGAFAFDRFALAPQREAAQVSAARTEGRGEALVESYGDKSIAVLPFVSMSADKDQEYFSDGISEELLNLLAKIPELRVIARTSSFSYKGKDVKVEEIGQQLRVAHVLEGSVRKSGNQVRITAQLIRASDSTHLWSQTWDRPLDNIFAVQDEIAGAVVEQLKIKLRVAAPKAKEVDPQAYALFLQAREIRRQHTAEGYEQAIALFEQAIALEPGYTAAEVARANVYTIQAGFGLRPVDEAYGLAREAVTRAVASDPEFAKAHDLLGWIAMNYDGDFAAAAQHYLRALALGPTELSIISNAAGLALYLGRANEAMALHEYVVTHDPINVVGHANLGFAYFAAKRYDEAIASWRTALRLAPGLHRAHAFIGELLLYKGEPEAAVAEAQKEPGEAVRLYTLAKAYHALGRQAEADAALAELMQKHDMTSSYSIARVLGYRNEVDRAFEWLDKAVANKDPYLVDVTLAETDPALDNVRKDSRWLPFLRKLGKAPEQLAEIKFDVKAPT